MNAETNRIEYKQELTDDLEKEAVAFLNYLEGGVLYIGIEKSGTAIGVTDIDRDILKILTSSLKKYGLYKRLITNYLYFCVP